MLFASLLIAAATAMGPQAQPDPTTASTRGTLELVKGYITKSAEQVRSPPPSSSARRVSTR
jgi:hypothetical protein